MLIKDDCFNYIKNIDSKSVDLILIDPPYLISKKSFFKIPCESTPKFLKEKYDISIDFGEWDKKELDLDYLFEEYYRILKNGGTLIVFYDAWKANELRSSAEKYKFKQPRIGTWVKNNPVPVNSKANYLSNAIEYFYTFTKKGKPTFNSSYDNAIYRYPICHGKERFDHPTQKPLKLITDLINKHSNPGDLVLDTFAGTGTTAHACVNEGRKYIMVENDVNYFEIMKSRINNISN